MSNEFDWKKFQFITAVQTALVWNLVKVENQKMRFNIREDNKEFFSKEIDPHLFTSEESPEDCLKGNKNLSLICIDLDDAFYAAERIPEDKSAADAAEEFVLFACENLRDEDYKQDMNAWYLRRSKS